MEPLHSPSASPSKVVIPMLTLPALTSTPATFPDPSPRPSANEEARTKEEDIAQPQSTSWTTLLAVSFSNFPVQAGWAMEETLVLPYMLSLGVKESLANVTYLINPIMSLCLQPLLAAWCDRFTSSWGRRRPFLFVLHLGMLIGAGIVISAEYFVHAATGEQTGPGDGASPLLVILIFLGIGFLNLSEDLMHTPSRALLVDKVPNEELERGNSFYGFVQAQGALLGLLITMVPWESLVPFTLMPGVTHFHACFIVLVCFVLLSFFVHIPIREDVSTEDTAEEALNESSLEEENDDAADSADVAPAMNSGNTTARSSMSAVPEGVEEVEVEVEVIEEEQEPDSSDAVCNDDEIQLPTGLQPLPSPRSPRITTVVDNPHWQYPVEKSHRASLARSEVSSEAEPETASVGDKSTISSNQIEGAQTSVFREVWNNFRSMPRKTLYLWWMQFWWWAIILNLGIWWTSWMAIEVFKADPTAEDSAPYNQGVWWGSLGVLIGCVTSMSSAHALSWFNDRFGVDVIYRTAVIVYSLMAISLWWIRSLEGALVLQGLFGIVYPAVNVNPYILMDMHDQEQKDEMAMKEVVAFPKEPLDIVVVKELYDMIITDTPAVGECQLDPIDSNLVGSEEHGGEHVSTITTVTISPHTHRSKSTTSAMSSSSHHSIDGDDHTAGRAALMNLTMTAAQILISVLSGVIIESYGDITVVFVIFGVICIGCQAIVALLELIDRKRQMAIRLNMFDKVMASVPNGARSRRSSRYVRPGDVPSRAGFPQRLLSPQFRLRRR